MQRPILNPSFLNDPDLDKPTVRRHFLRTVFRIGYAGLRGLIRALMWRPFRHRAEPPPQDEDAPAAAGLFSFTNLLRRLAFVPIVMMLIVAAMVYRGTHPVPFDAGGTPAAAGVYYQPVAMMAADGQRLEGWLVPAVNAQMVVQQQEVILRKQRPAVVLVHDQDATRAQMLPLVQPLHQAGLVVLVIGVRGEGTGYSTSRTFGLRETMDIHAAVQMLRRRPSVDASRIAVIGSGTGATAALLTAGQDWGITALVLDSPLRRTEQVLTRIGPAHNWLAWLRPVAKWAFEFSHAVDADDLNISRHRQVLDRLPVLMVGDPDHATAAWTPQRLEKVVEFLKQNLDAQPVVAATR